MRTYLEANQGYHTILGIPDDARLGPLQWGVAGRTERLACDISFGAEGSARYVVSRRHRAFSFRACPNGIFIHGDMGYRTEDDSCAADLH